MNGWRAMCAGFGFVLVAGCGGGDDHCPGGAVRRPVGPGLSAEESTSEVERWPVSDRTGLIELNTSEYRFDGEVAIIGPERVAITLAETFTVESCVTSGPAQDVDDLLDARFGATFEVDPDSAELLRATCNGCA